MKDLLSDLLFGAVGALAMYLHRVSRKKIQFTWKEVFLRMTVGIVASVLVGKILQPEVINVAWLLNVRDAVVGITGIVSYNLFTVVDKESTKIMTEKLGSITKTKNDKR